MITKLPVDYKELKFSEICDKVNEIVEYINLRNKDQPLKELSKVVFTIDLADSYNKQALQYEKERKSQLQAIDYDFVRSLFDRNISIFKIYSSIYNEICDIEICSFNETTRSITFNYLKYNETITTYSFKIPIAEYERLTEYYISEDLKMIKFDNNDYFIYDKTSEIPFKEEVYIKSDLLPPVILPNNEILFRRKVYKNIDHYKVKDVIGNSYLLNEFYVNIIDMPKCNLKKDIYKVIAIDEHYADVINNETGKRSEVPTELLYLVTYKNYIKYNNLKSYNF